MTKQEHLEKIKAKCEQKIAAVDRECRHLADIYQIPLKQAVAGWVSTIKTIDMLDDLTWPQADVLEQHILDAWPEELL